MQDKERMLMVVIAALRQIASLRPLPDDPIRLESTIISDDKLRPGDIVICMTSGIHEWTAAEFIEYISRERGEYLVRELGGERTCNIYNDSLAILKGVRESPYYGPLLLKGDQYLFYEKVKKAFKLGGHYWHKFDRVEFPEKYTARVYVRVKWWASNRSDEENIKDFKHSYRPFSFYMHWTKKTPIKAILEEMIAYGYSKELVDTVQTEGQ